MAFSAILTLLSLVVWALAAPTSPGSLTVSIKAEQDSVSSKDFAVSATVSNPTSEDIRVVKFNTILDDNPTYRFQLFKDDKEVDFKGVRITPDLTNDATFTVIPAGDSVTVKHSLGSSYKFEDAGAGTYTVKPFTHFQYGSSSAEVVDLQADSITVEVTKIDGTVTVEQTTPQCTDSTKLAQLRGALSEARALAGGAAADVRNHPNSAAMNRYFGANSRDTVWYNLDRIAGDLPSSGTRILSCTDTHNVCASNSGIVAYTLVVTSGGQIVGSDIYGCNPFWGAPPTNQICSGADTGSRGSIILHELSHAVFGSADTVYGCSSSAALSDSQKLGNADNYACYGVQTYHDYNC